MILSKGKPQFTFGFLPLIYVPSALKLANKNSLRIDSTVNIFSLGTFSSQIPVASQVSYSFSFLLSLFPESFLVPLKIIHTEKVLQYNQVVCREHKNFFFFFGSTLTPESSSMIDL